MAHDHLIEMLDLDAEVLHEYFRDLISWVGREAVDRPRIIDLGAGSGTGSLALARGLSGSTVTAVDVSPEMLFEPESVMSGGLARYPRLRGGTTLPTGCRILLPGFSPGRPGRYPDPSLRLEDFAGPWQLLQAQPWWRPVRLPR